MGVSPCISLSLSTCLCLCESEILCMSVTLYVPLVHLSECVWVQTYLPMYISVWVSRPVCLYVYICRYTLLHMNQSPSFFPASFSPLYLYIMLISLYIKVCLYMYTALSLRIYECRDFFMDHLCCVCVCMDMSPCTSACMCAQLHACVFLHAHQHAWTFPCASPWSFLYICMCAHLYVFMVSMSM